MAEKSSRLAEILKQEYKSTGAASGFASAAGKRIREKMDIRNVLFGGTGVGSLIGRKIFGKGYSAIADKQDQADKISSQTAPLISAQTEKLDIISVNSQITAKNSMALPAMARDMNLMKLNVFKLVKLQGGTANTNKTDMFWQKSKLREAEYEQQFKKASATKVTTPTKVESAKSTESPLGLLGLLGSVVGTVGERFAPLITTIGAVSGALLLFSGALKGVYNWIASSEIGKSLGLKPTDDYKIEKNGYSSTTNSIVNGVAGVAGAGAGAMAISGAKKLMGATGAASEAILDARTTSVGSLANSKPTSTWGRFLKWLATRSPKLIQGLGLRLAQASALAAIPAVGWIMAAVQLGFSLWTAYEIYELWKEFNKEEEKSPTQVDEQSTVRKLDNASDNTPTNVTPSSNGGNMAQLIRDKFKAAGFNDVQAQAAVANAMAESNLNPNAHNKTGKEDSVGLFQMNRNGGLGTGYTVEQLKDPNTNIDLAIDAAKKSRSFMNATTVQDAVAAFVNDVERPANKLAEINKRTSIALGENTQSLTASATRADGSTLATAFSMESLMKDLLAMSSSGSTTVNNITNNTSGGGSLGTQADVMDAEFGKLLLRMAG